MLPVLSTRAFIRVPRPSDLDLARNQRFLDLEVWLEPFFRSAEVPLADFQQRLQRRGLRAPCVHLPVRGPEGLLDVDTSELLTAQEALDSHARGLDAAAALGAQVAIVHVRGTVTDGLGRLCELAASRSIRLALETDTFPGSGPQALVKTLQALGSVAYRHGVCVDLSRTRLTGDQLRALGGRLLWLEISRARTDQPHGPPEDRDEDLRSAMEAVELPYVAYEVVPVGPESMPAGDAQLTQLLRRVSAFHTGADRPKYEGASPFLPMG